MRETIKALMLALNLNMCVCSQYIADMWYEIITAISYVPKKKTLWIVLCIHVFIYVYILLLLFSFQSWNIYFSYISVFGYWKRE